MNLYWVAEYDAEWGVFVFARTRNKARAMLPDFGNGTEYISTKANLIGKTDEVEKETVVDSDYNPLYPIVLKLGGQFTSLDGGEEEGDQNGTNSNKLGCDEIARRYSITRLQF